MPALLVVAVGLAALVVCSQRAADHHARAAHQECLERGGFPVSKGPRSYDYHCFAKDPYLRSEKD